MTFTEMAEEWERQWVLQRTLDASLVSESEILSIDDQSHDARTEDPLKWQGSFARWLNSACAQHPRVFGGMSRLHIAFSEWESTRGGVACSREAFRRLLEEVGFLVCEVNGTVLVSGLTFSEDVTSATEESSSARRLF